MSDNNTIGKLTIARLNYCNKKLRMQVFKSIFGFYAIKGANKEIRNNG